MKRIKNFVSLFPYSLGSESSANLFRFGLKKIKKFSVKDKMRVSFDSKFSYDLRLFDKIPEEGLNPKKVIRSSILKFFKGIPNWRNPKFKYNICAPTNSSSVALMALAQEFNIHNINSDFAGNSLLAEKIISKMMADLIKLSHERVRALFSFGGTASNLYAMKLSINKIFPEAGKKGIPKNISVLISEDSHFSHKTVADWLGIGTDNLIIVKSDKEGRSSLKDAEEKLEKVIKKGKVVSCFMLNGGPFYNFAIDDINGFVMLRDKLVKKYKLDYKPHIHVDSVIGWVWLMFNDYDFSSNPLKISKPILQLIQKQTKRASMIRFADSWGVDFHKGLGGVPTPAGLFISNNSNELSALSKSFRGVRTDHLGGYWAEDNPSDITLETSRSAAPALGALGSLLTLGKDGYRLFLANQIGSTVHLRKNISKNTPFISANDNSLGFNTMVVFAPKNILSGKERNWNNLKSLLNKNEKLLDNLNKTLSSFYEWSLKKGPLGCSFSKSFSKTKKGGNISGLKYCIVSPHTDTKSIDEEISMLNKKFKMFLKENDS